MLTCHSRTTTGVINKITDGRIPFVQTGVQVSGSWYIAHTGLLKSSRHVIKVMSCTCVVPSMTGQNVCCENICCSILFQHTCLSFLIVSHFRVYNTSSWPDHPLFHRSYSGLASVFICLPAR